MHTSLYTYCTLNIKRIDAWIKEWLAGWKLEIHKNKINGQMDQLNKHVYHSGQHIIYHQPRFPWNKEISITKPPFGDLKLVFSVAMKSDQIISIKKLNKPKDRDRSPTPFFQFWWEISTFQGLCGILARSPRCNENITWWKKVFDQVTKLQTCQIVHWKNIERSRPPMGYSWQVDGMCFFCVSPSKKHGRLSHSFAFKPPAF